MPIDILLYMLSSLVHWPFILSFSLTYIQLVVVYAKDRRYLYPSSGIFMGCRINLLWLTSPRRRTMLRECKQESVFALNFDSKLASRECASLKFVRQANRRAIDNHHVSFSNYGHRGFATFEMVKRFCTSQLQNLVQDYTQSSYSFKRVSTIPLSSTYYLTIAPAHIMLTHKGKLTYT